MKNFQLFHNQLNNFELFRVKSIFVFILSVCLWLSLYQPQNEIAVSFFLLSRIIRSAVSRKRGVNKATCGCIRYFTNKDYCICTHTHSNSLLALFFKHTVELGQEQRLKWFVEAIFITFFEKWIKSCRISTDFSCPDFIAPSVN